MSDLNFSTHDREYRKWLFQDRWLLPLNDESGTGALSEEDVACLHSGWIVFVAPKQGGRYFLTDHGRSHGHSLDSFLRVLFFLGTRATDTEAQSKGVTVIRLISTGHGEPHLSRDFLQTAQMAWKMGKEALPYRVERAIFLKEDAAKGSAVQLYLRHIVNFVMKIFQSDMAVTVPVSSPTCAAETLTKTLGIARDAIPVSHGGTWAHSRLGEWKIAQSANERGLQASLVSVLASTAAESDKLRLPEIQAVQYRKAYKKRRIRESNLEQDAKRLRIDNERLKTENAFLSALFDQVMDVVALVEPDDKTDGEAGLFGIAATALTVGGIA